MMKDVISAWRVDINKKSNFNFLHLSPEKSLKFRKIADDLDSIENYRQPVIFK